MIKGCQKRIIHLKNTNSDYFEEAYFILKDDQKYSAAENDMIKEAERIAEYAGAKRDRSPKSKKSIGAAAVILLCTSFSFLILGILMLCAAL